MGFNIDISWTRCKTVWVEMPSPPNLRSKTASEFIELCLNLETEQLVGEKCPDGLKKQFFCMMPFGECRTRLTEPPSFSYGEHQRLIKPEAAQVNELKIWEYFYDVFTDGSPTEVKLESAEQIMIEKGVNIFFRVICIGVLETRKYKLTLDEANEKDKSYYLFETFSEKNIKDISKEFQKYLKNYEDVIIGDNFIPTEYTAEYFINTIESVNNKDQRLETNLKPSGSSKIINFKNIKTNK